MAFYGSAGYLLLDERITQDGSSKTLGAGIRRYALEKRLAQGDPG